MTLYRLTGDNIASVPNVSFSALGLHERGDLQRLLRDNISILAADTLVISEEFSHWDRSDRRIDLLGVDRTGSLVVVELKRTTDDSFADLQALRYAAMVAQMTFDEAVEALRRYLTSRDKSDDPQSILLQHLGWAEPTDGRFNEDVKIVLAAADFSPEVTSTVLWLNERDLDIKCIRLQPFQTENDILLDVQQIIPLPEAADYQVQIKQKKRESRTATEQSADWTRYDVTVGNETIKSQYKRDVIFHAVTFLIHRGVSPDVLEELATRRVFWVVDGETDSQEFREQIAKSRPNDRNAVSRVFSKDGQLFHRDGKTLGISNQWNKATMEETMDAWVNQFGHLGLAYTPTRET
jgi:hypothetical protein